MNTSRLDERGNIIVNSLSSVLNGHSTSTTADLFDTVAPDLMTSEPCEAVKPSNRRLSMKMKELSQNYKEVTHQIFMPIDVTRCH